MESTIFGYTLEEIKSFVETITVCTAAVATGGAALWRWIWVPSSKLITKINSIHDLAEKHFPTLIKIAEEFKPNGGNSFRDVMNRLENSQSTTREMNRLVITEMDIASFEVDKNGQYTWVSPKWEDITCIDITEAMGNGWINSIHPWDSKRVVDEWEEALKQNRTFKSTYYVNQNNPVKVKAYVMPVRDAKKNIISYTGTLSLVEKDPKDSTTTL